MDDYIAQENASAQAKEDYNDKLPPEECLQADEPDEQTLAEEEPAERCGPHQDAGASHIELGKRGERAAVEFLQRHGLDILGTNWTCPAGEADIVAWDGHSLRFVEVKTRRGTGKGFPEEAVTPEKRHRYECIAEYYLRDFERTEIGVTFDIIGIIVNSPNRAFLRYHRDVFVREC